MHRPGYVEVDRVITATRRPELAMEQARDFELVIDLETARALTLRIPPSLLARANRVVQ